MHLKVVCFVEAYLEAASLEDGKTTTLKSEVIRQCFREDHAEADNNLFIVFRMLFFRMLAIISTTLFCSLYASVILSIYAKLGSQSSTR